MPSDLDELGGRGVIGRPVARTAAVVGTAAVVAAGSGAAGIAATTGVTIAGTIPCSVRLGDVARVSSGSR